eukprot:943463-Pyramimonas_sp.AAC.1
MPHDMIRVRDGTHGKFNRQGTWKRTHKRTYRDKSKGGDRKREKKMEWNQKLENDNAVGNQIKRKREEGRVQKTT